MTTAYDVPPNDLIEQAKEELKKDENLKPPEWASLIKTGAHRERPPQQEDFWYIRAAALLRKYYTKGPIGVSRLRTEYGGRKHRGVKPEEHRKGSGSVIRKITQQLERSGYVKAGKKGREITPKGRKFLDNIALQVLKTSKPEPKVEKPVPKPEPKAEPKPEPKVEQPQEKPKEEPKPIEEKPEEKPKQEPKSEKPKE